MFNLGYLPGSDKSVQTQPLSTLNALKSAIALMKKPSIMSVLAYTGHPGGRQEAQAVKEWARQLSKNDYHVTIQIPKTAKNNPPELILIEAIK
jgi:hypothetical protein